MSAHQDTYHSFVRLAAGGVIACAMIVVALAAMTVIGGTAFWIGAIGLIVGLALVAMSLLSSLSWTASLVVLAAMIALTVVTL
ncbi:MAG: aa3-type cytochrome c oxidase subunit IV [Rhodobiaceae bacterium]|nr:aa3-type cytochrome c oxidase subunit IV [Rhodobiaceae bacterium]